MYSHALFSSHMVTHSSSDNPNTGSIGRVSSESHPFKQHFRPDVCIDTKSIIPRSENKSNTSQLGIFFAPPPPSERTVYAPGLSCEIQRKIQYKCQINDWTWYLLDIIFDLESVKKIFEIIWYFLLWKSAGEWHSSGSKTSIQRSILFSYKIQGKIQYNVDRHVLYAEFRFLSHSNAIFLHFNIKFYLTLNKSLNYLLSHHILLNYPILVKYNHLDRRHWNLAYRYVCTQIQTLRILGQNHYIIVHIPQCFDFSQIAIPPFAQHMPLVYIDN